jgi:hypothetical protein
MSRQNTSNVEQESTRLLSLLHIHEVPCLLIPSLEEVGRAPGEMRARVATSAINPKFLLWSPVMPRKPWIARIWGSSYTLWVESQLDLGWGGGQGLGRLQQGLQDFLKSGLCFQDVLGCFQVEEGLWNDLVLSLHSITA